MRSSTCNRVAASLPSPLGAEPCAMLGCRAFTNLCATLQGNAIGSIFYTPGNFFNPTLIGEAITGMPAGRKLSQFTKSPGPDGNPDPYGFVKGVRARMHWHMQCCYRATVIAARGFMRHHLCDPSMHHALRLALPFKVHV